MGNQPLRACPTHINMYHKACHRQIEERATRIQWSPGGEYLNDMLHRRLWKPILINTLSK